MTCQRCGSDRVADVTAKSSDCNSFTLKEKLHDGYVPDDMGIGGGDYIEFSFCLACGQLQGEWPQFPDWAH